MTATPPSDDSTGKTGESTPGTDDPTPTADGSECSANRFPPSLQALPNPLHARSGTIALVAVLAVLGVTIAGAGLAVGGDSIAIFEFEQEEGIEAESGETVELNVTVRTDGGYTDEGLQTTEASVAINESVGTITDIDHGPWMESDDEDIEVEIDEEIDGGTASVRHHRDPAGDGARGYERFFTVTIDLEEDAPASDAVVRITGADAVLIDGYSIRTTERTTVIAVDGGGEEIEPDLAAVYEDDEESVAVTTAQEAGRDGGNNGLLSTTGLLAGTSVLGIVLIVVGSVVWWRDR